MSKAFGTVAFVMALALVQARAEEKDGASLVGGYTLTSGMRGGKEIDEDKIKGSTAKFTKDRIVVYAKDMKELYVSSYKLDTGKKPWGITMTNEAKVKKDDKEVKEGTKETVMGLIEKDGDTVRLVYALPGGKTPTGFDAKDEKHIMVVMKNLKK